VFVFLLIFTFFGIWAPYLNNLSKKIWKTKGMLNMIPIDIIKGNSILEDHILAKDILNAMK